MTHRDYYDILGVQRSATDDEIKKAYRRLAKKFHPDANKGDRGAEQRFKEVQEAYDVLSDRQKRSQYDRFGRAGVAGGGPHPAGGARRTYTWSNVGPDVDFGDLTDFFSARGGDGPASVFEHFFRQVGARSAPDEPEARTDGDLEQEVTLTFEQAIRGVSLELSIAGGPAAGEVVTVRIPPGVDDGQRIRVRGRGRAGRRGHPPGDLYIVCRVEPHRYFRRLGNDIYLEVPISITEAALGAKIDIPTLHGPATVRIPAGTAAGAKLRLAGRGVENPRTHERGDQYAVIKIVPPKSLDDRQTRLLRELAETLRENPRAGLWDV